MKLCDKLDLLQTLAVKCADAPHRLYLIELLAEHAEEEALSAEFLAWVVASLSFGLREKNLLDNPSLIGYNKCEVNTLYGT